MERPADSLVEAAWQRRIITARCRGCGNAASFLARDIAEFTGHDLPIGNIRFRCASCGAKDAEIGSREIDPDRKPDIIVWRPTRLR
jgi:hypothetical protein